MNSVFKLISTFPDPENFAASREEWKEVHGYSNILIDCMTKEVSYDLHWTPMSAKFCFEGTEHYQTREGCRYAVDDSRFLLFNQDKEYKSFICSNKEVRSVTINFSETFIKKAKEALIPDGRVFDDDGDSNSGKAPLFFEKLYPADKYLIFLLNNLRRNFDNDGEETDQTEEMFFRIFSHLYSLQELEASKVNEINKSKEATRIELYKRLALAKDYIYSSYSENIQLKDLSRVTLLNHYYLLRLFKSYYGETPHQYLTQRRIEVSKTLLAQGMSVTEVCKKVGFTDLSSFGKLFKKNTGITPKEYLQ